jgi:hypothetical protein
LLNLLKYHILLAGDPAGQGCFYPIFIKWKHTMKITKSSNTVKTLSLTLSMAECKLVSGGSETTTGTVKSNVAPELEPTFSDTVTGKVK